MFHSIFNIYKYILKGSYTDFQVQYKILVSFVEIRHQNNTDYVEHRGNKKHTVTAFNSSLPFHNLLNSHRTHAKVLFFSLKKSLVQSYESVDFLKNIKGLIIFLSLNDIHKIISSYTPKRRKRKKRKTGWLTKTKLIVKYLWSILCVKSTTNLLYLH